MAQKPIDKDVAHRFAELVGQGMTQHEAARAADIGTRTGKRLMTKPEIRQIVEETRAASEMGDLDPAIRALLKATDEEGNPDLERQAQGAELALDWLASRAGDAGSGGSLPEGVIVVLARPRDEQPLGTANR